MLKLFHNNIIFNRQQAHGYVQDERVCCWLMNAVVYSLKTLISFMKAFVSRKSYTSCKACIQWCLLSLAQYGICSFQQQ